MDYKTYKANHFGKPIDIYTRDAKLVFEEVTPVGGGTVTSSPATNGEVFSFEIDADGTAVEVPVDCDLRLSSQNTVTPEDRI